MTTRKSKAYIVWILGALSTVSPFAIDLYLPAFSQIAEDFNTTPAKISLSVSSYFIGMAIGQILYGPLLDRFGRKIPLYAGLAIFTIASIGCVLSTSIEMLVVFRFIQALGGSAAWVGAVTMVRDFFAVEESAKIFSLLILILGVSPLLAPTIGGFIATEFGWTTIFTTLAFIVVLIGVIVFLFLPQGQPPDNSVSLAPRQMLHTFWTILREPQFYTYTLAGAFSFSSLFIYVAGSPVIFMEIFDTSPKVFGGIFALLSVGFIGGSQFNIYLNKKIPSARIFRTALFVQVVASIIFVVLTWTGWLTMITAILMFFICLSCIGLLNPNANALALAPFTKNVGSASALLGCIQLGTAAIASTGVGFFDATSALPIVGLMLLTSFAALVILTLGKRKITHEIKVGGTVPGIGH
jgi:MFS transporter, DHA1 family, multidrug resistance protein